MNRRERFSNRALLNAVALQDHFTRSLSLSSHVSQQHQLLTLAQHLGLANRPSTRTLTCEEWQQVQQQSAQRKDALHGCPICHEPLMLGDQVLLSCSHVFHKLCLKRFEKYKQQRWCPVCRAEHYQKMFLRTPSAVYKNFSATRIQAAFRGYKSRKNFEELRWKNPPPEDPQRRKFWFASKLKSATDKLLGQMAVDEDDVNLVMAEIESTLAASKRIYNSVVCENEGPTHASAAAAAAAAADVEWNLVIEKAIERYDMECSICIMSLQRDGGACLTLLSCSHLFHATCITEFESFNDISSQQEQLLCPICRSTYHRLEL